MAEKEGFEPSNTFLRYTISNRAPSTKLGDFSKCHSNSGDLYIIIENILQVNRKKPCCIIIFIL